ncbi:Peptidyl-tRNA hydrolase II domain-containing protein [Rozella allomycis CSF55]|uniref:peptidyl-tRNA hydrolase n=1 Tax=Rozella allomycis (strain CSF55) TaxID=988480 RepID=A0A075AND1_ROZAC|nr:Peptidyl-tRNA hydrolase II domain-containing protein [Rozella allomycis CSF55]|eukprot:EPZ31327.1 Peptidyl-tRNA hydrolase II domain-containing protein [Rozella allomycis CSF55]
MQKGKAAAQCCHATLSNYKDALKLTPSAVKSWEYNGQPKVTLKVGTEEEMIDLVKQARKAGIVANYIRDAGRTQVASGTKTVAAIGPGNETIQVKKDPYQK